MNYSSLILPSEYMIVANTECCEDNIIQLKQYLKNTIGTFPSAYSVPHITFSAFSMQEKHQDLIIQRLRHKLKQVSSFKVRLDGLSAWESSSTIFIQTSQEESLNLGSMIFQALYNRLVTEIHHSLKTKSGTAHVTVARGLSPENFEIAKALLLPISFKKEFTVKHITLLKRKANAISWTDVCKIPLLAISPNNQNGSSQLPLFP